MIHGADDLGLHYSSKHLHADDELSPQTYNRSKSSLTLRYFWEMGPRGLVRQSLALTGFPFLQSLYNDFMCLQVAFYVLQLCKSKTDLVLTDQELLNPRQV